MAFLRRHPRTPPAPEVRAVSIASGLGRVAIGVGLALAPRQALTALGFSDHSPATVAVARIAGGRDVAMGVTTLLALDDPDRLAAATLANAAVDAGDAATFAATLASGGGAVRGAALRGIGAALPAAAVGLWVASRLRSPG